MNKFDEVAKQAGWVNAYEGLPIYYRVNGEYLQVNFPTLRNLYDEYKEPTRYSDNYILSMISIMYCSNMSKIKNRAWFFPLMVADFYSHMNFGMETEKRNKYYQEQELKHALIAIDNDPTLTQIAFSREIREDIIKHIKEK